MKTTEEVRQRNGARKLEKIRGMDGETSLMGKHDAGREQEEDWMLVFMRSYRNTLKRANIEPLFRMVWDWFLNASLNTTLG